MSTAAADTRYDQAVIEADETLPMIHIRRDFARYAGPALPRAHRSRAVRPLGRPRGLGATILEWDATTNGKWRFAGGDGNDTMQYFRGSFHTVSPEKIVQTFTWEAMPDDVALETMAFEDLGDGRTRLHATSLCDSFEARDGWLRSGMEVGVNDGYAAIDRMLADGTL